MLNDSHTAATIDSPAARGAVEFYVDLVRDGLAAQPSDLSEGWCGQAIADGKVAIAFEGNWLLPTIKGSGILYSIHPMPSNVLRGNLAFTVAYAIASSSHHMQAAWTLLSWLTGREGMQLWTNGGVALPSRNDVTPLPGRRCSSARRRSRRCGSSASASTTGSGSQRTSSALSSPEPRRSTACWRPCSSGERGASRQRDSREGLALTREPASRGSQGVIKEAA